MTCGAWRVGHLRGLCGAFGRLWARRLSRPRCGAIVKVHRDPPGGSGGSDMRRRRRHFGLRFLLGRPAKLPHGNRRPCASSSLVYPKDRPGRTKLWGKETCMKHGVVAAIVVLGILAMPIVAALVHGATGVYCHCDQRLGPSCPGLGPGPSQVPRHVMASRTTCPRLSLRPKTPSFPIPFSVGPQGSSTDSAVTGPQLAWNRTGIGNGSTVIRCATATGRSVGTRSATATAATKTPWKS